MHFETHVTDGWENTRLPIVCLNFEQTIAGISISIHFRTIAPNSMNFQTHPVCNLLSTNEINPSENIFNNNVMQNRNIIIVHPERRKAPATLHHAGGRIYVDILPIIWHRLIVQKGPSTSQSDLVGSRIL